MITPIANTIPMFVCWEGVFVEQMGQNAQEPILPATVRPEFVNAGKEKIDGEDLTLYVILDKSVPYGQIWESALIRMYLNDE